MLLIQNAKFVKGLDPAADLFAGANVRSDIVNLSAYAQVTFVIHKGVGATGTSTVIVNSVDDVSGTTRTAIAFRYKTVTSGDTDSTLQTATASGFTTTAGSSQLYLVTVDATELSGSDKYCELEMDESADDPVLGSVLAILSSPSYASDQLPTAIV